MSNQGVSADQDGVVAQGQMVPVVKMGVACLKDIRVVMPDIVTRLDGLLGAAGEAGTNEPAPVSKLHGGGAPASGSAGERKPDNGGAPLGGQSAEKGERVDGALAAAELYADVVARVCAAVTEWNQLTVRQNVLAGALGVSADGLAAWEGVLGDMGMQASSAGKLIGALGNGLKSAMESGGESPAGESLRALGLSAEKLRELSPEEQFQAVATALKDMPDAAGATAAANELLGADGAAFVAQLRKRREGVDELLGRQRQLNILSDEGRSGAEAYAGAYNRLNTVIGGAVSEFSGLVGGAVAPLMDMGTDCLAAGLGQLRDGFASVAQSAAMGDWAGIAVAIAGVVAVVFSAVLALGKLKRLAASIVGKGGGGFAIPVRVVNLGGGAMSGGESGGGESDGKKGRRKKKRARVPRRVRRPKRALAGGLVENFRTVVTKPAVVAKSIIGKAMDKGRAFGSVFGKGGLKTAGRAVGKVFRPVGMALSALDMVDAVRSGDTAKVGGSLGSIGGSAAGAMAGAAIGSVVPVIGTALGGIVGGILGGMGGESLGEFLGGMFAPNKDGQAAAGEEKGALAGASEATSASVVAKAAPVATPAASGETSAAVPAVAPAASVVSHTAPATANAQPLPGNASAMEGSAGAVPCGGAAAMTMNVGGITIAAAPGMSPDEIADVVIRKLQALRRDGERRFLHDR
ncbi:hypothetical protein GGQ74_000843 [Desulfobaculum xiamenense]|uniref:Tail tape measure protein n=1 Tax=Desulfobaculum xiamenense TaxID=995050 RepID=A0A846QLW4_9BACT|nr:hypothetical protein [Desulfobaculum xiamenense]NJB67203.1 hypothetical protein [Desulfobaculum xiamenense]